MDRRLLLLLLVAILVIAATVPALGSRTTVAPTFDRKASANALAKAKLALQAARLAKQDATSALDSSEVAAAIAAAAKADAANAQKAADGAQGTATATQALLESTRVKQAIAKAEAETESTSYVQLAGGPSVSIDVPASGLIEVWGQATFSEGGAVALFEDGQMMPGQSDICTEGGALFTGGHLSPPETMGTPGVAGFADCGTGGPPGAVMFETTPGAHTYELRYKICGCGPEPVAFSNRLLRVGPRL